MSNLTEEERKRIYEEEKARFDARESLSQDAPPPNKKAKDGLVLSLGSLIVGYLFGIPAIVYGFQGLNHAKKFPKSGGKGLSLFNLILGIITSAVYIYFTLQLLSQ